MRDYVLGSSAVAAVRGSQNMFPVKKRSSAGCSASSDAKSHDEWPSVSFYISSSDDSRRVQPPLQVKKCDSTYSVPRKRVHLFSGLAVSPCLWNFPFSSRSNAQKSPEKLHLWISSSSFLSLLLRSFEFDISGWINWLYLGRFWKILINFRFWKAFFLFRNELNFSKIDASAERRDLSLKPRPILKNKLKNIVEREPSQRLKGLV